jgi:hypothetical protein
MVRGTALLLAPRHCSRLLSRLLFSSQPPSTAPLHANVPRPRRLPRNRALSRPRHVDVPLWPPPLDHALFRNEARSRLQGRMRDQEAERQARRGAGYQRGEARGERQSDVYDRVGGRCEGVGTQVCGCRREGVCRVRLSFFPPSGVSRLGR